MLTRALMVLAVVTAAACQVAPNQGYEPVQPIAYSHAVHAGQYQIPCLYCHYGAERGRHAGIPSTSVCLNCHSQVKKDSPEIKKLAEAAQTGVPIEWTKVHRLPDFAYFNHASHVVAGQVACQTCHGPVEEMVRVKQQEPMTMGWCLDCHRAQGRAAAASGQVAAPTDCAACHQ